MDVRKGRVVWDPANPRDGLTDRVIGTAIAVHREVGPGLLESVYRDCMRYELAKRGVPFGAEVTLSVRYDGHVLASQFRIDFLVANELVVELKSVDTLHPVHRTQVITYLRLGGFKRGLLINFNVSKLVDGVRRISV